ncbi:MAG: hypothetical protein WBB18_05120, partial [Nodosilinea sp.]
SLIGVALGIILKSILTNSTDSRFLLISESLLTQFRLWFLRLLDIFQQSPVAAVLVAVFYSVVILKVIRKSSNIFLRGNEQRGKNLDVIFFFNLFILLSPAITFLALAINGILYIPRYLLNAFWFPVLFSWVGYPESQILLLEKAIRYIWLALVVALTILSIPMQPLYGDYYPPIVECVDRAIVALEETSGESARVGISNYWHAKLITEFSKQNLEVVQVNRDLSDFVWINNPQWYREAYDFALIPQEVNGVDNFFVPDRIRLEQINGPPKEKSLCNNVALSNYHDLATLGKNDDLFNRVSVFFYEPGELRTQHWQKVGETYTWLACDLPSQLGTVAENCSRNKAVSAESGFLTFGPYEELPVGDYTASITYASPIDESTPIGHWDVLASLSTEEFKEILKKPLLGTGERTVEVSGEVQVREDWEQKPVQIRTYVDAQASMSVYKISLQRIR